MMSASACASQHSQTRNTSIEKIAIENASRRILTAASLIDRLSLFNMLRTSISRKEFRCWKCRNVCPLILVFKNFQHRRSYQDLQTMLSHVPVATDQNHLISHTSNNLESELEIIRNSNCRFAYQTRRKSVNALVSGDLRSRFTTHSSKTA